MNKLSLTCLLFFFIPTVFAQKPVPCTTPPQWISRLFEYEDREQYIVAAQLYYDATYQRRRTVQKVQLGSDLEYLDTIYLYNQKIQYEYNFLTQQCQNKTFTEPWRNFAIPQNASFYGESYIGSSAIPNTSVLTTSWGTNYTDSKGNNVEYYGTWTLESCLPIRATYIGDSFGNIHSYFTNITVGITDPNAFTPRPECL